MDIMIVVMVLMKQQVIARTEPVLKIGSVVIKLDNAYQIFGFVMVKMIAVICRRATSILNKDAM